MSRLVTWTGTALLIGAAWLAAPAAHAQTPYGRYAPVYPSRYWGYTGDPYGTILHGYASVIHAQGQFLINLQEVALMRESVRSAKVDSRRKELEEWLWERDHLPTWEDERERVQKENLRRSRNDPPLTEIWSAKALNDLLVDASKIQSLGANSSSSPLTEDLLAKINVTTGKRDGNMGLLRAGKLLWPLMLRRKAFDPEHDRLDELFAQAVEQASKGQQIKANVLEEIMTTLQEYHEHLKRMVKAAREEDRWTPTLYVDAKSYLNQLNDAVRALQQPDAGQYLTGKYMARGKTVGELIQYMRENGLRFAPASPGAEGAYTALHRALAAYDTNAGTQIDDNKENKR